MTIPPTEWTLVRRLCWLMGQLVAFITIWFGSFCLLIIGIVGFVHHSSAFPHVEVAALALEQHNSVEAAAQVIDLLGVFPIMSGVSLWCIGGGWAVLLLAALPGAPDAVPTWQARIPVAFGWQPAPWKTVMVSALALAGFAAAYPNIDTDFPHVRVMISQIGRLSWAQIGMLSTVYVVSILIIEITIWGFVWGLLERAFSSRVSALVFVIIFSLFSIWGMVYGLVWPSFVPSNYFLSTGLGLVVYLWMIGVRLLPGGMLLIVVGTLLSAPVTPLILMYGKPTGGSILGVLVAVGATVWLWRWSRSLLVKHASP